MEKNFKNLIMMEWSDRWANARSLSDSNPEPFSTTELSDITGEDWSHLPMPSLAYQSVQGDVTLRQMMVNQWYKNSATHDLLLTAGAQEALFVAFNALIKANDHVVCFTPIFEPLSLMPEQIGARVTKLPLQGDWSIDFDSLETTLKDDAKLLVLNFPHNPTGTHIDLNTLTKVIKLCDQHGVYILSDEVFRGLEHEPQNRLPAVADLYPRAVSLGVLSKAFALPAVRLGWLLSQDKALLKRMIEIKNHLSICVSGLDVTFMKKMMPHDDALWQRSIDIINKNKRTLKDALQHNDNFQCHMGSASGTCFVFRKDAALWSETLANTHNIKVLPGLCFVTKHEGFRLSLGQRHFDKPMSLWLKHSG